MSHLRALRAAWISWMNHWHTCSAKRQTQTHKHTFCLLAETFFKACFHDPHSPKPSLICSSHHLRWFLLECFVGIVIYWCDVMWCDVLKMFSLFFFSTLLTHSILLCLSVHLEEASTVSERGNVTDLVTPTWVFFCFIPPCFTLFGI